MPTLSTSLHNLLCQSNLITHLSSLNTPREGPYTRAYLSSATNIFTTIREAHEHERKLFNYIGMDRDGGEGGGSGGGGGGGGGGKVVERRGTREEDGKSGLGGLLSGGGSEGGVGDGKGKGKGRGEGEDMPMAWNDPESLLTTALRLVDEYKSMPRAREHILSLLSTQSSLSDHLTQLEQEIQALSTATPSFSNNNNTSNMKKGLGDSLFDETPLDMDMDIPDLGDMSINESSPRGNSKNGKGFDPDEWLKREEEELKRLEKEIGEKRKEKRNAAASGGGGGGGGGGGNGAAKGGMIRNVRKSIGLGVGPGNETSPHSRRISSGTSPSSNNVTGGGGRRTSLAKIPATPRMKELGSGMGRTPSRGNGVGARGADGSPERRQGGLGEGGSESKTPLTNFFGVGTPGQSTSTQATPLAQSQSHTTHTLPSTQQPPPAPSTITKPKSIFDRKRLQARQTISLAQAQVQAQARAVSSSGVGGIGGQRGAGSGSSVLAAPIEMESTAGASDIGGMAQENLNSSIGDGTRAGTSNEQSTPTRPSASSSSNTASPTTPNANNDTQGTPTRRAEAEADTSMNSSTGGTPKVASRLRSSAGGQGSATQTPGRQRKVVEGVEIRSDVRAAVTKIWATLGDTLRSGENAPVEETAGAQDTIKRIAFLAQSPLPPPLSPSSASTLSTALSSLPGASAPPPRASPLTTQSILTCHLLLALLRSPELTVQMTELKELLGVAAKERGWDEMMGTKVIYGAVAKKAVKIDRRGGGGGKVLFC